MNEIATARISLQRPSGGLTIAALEHSGSAPRAFHREADDSPLYPPLEPFETGVLDVGDGHRLYWEQSGNPKGVPVIFLHGGPGAGVAPAYRRFFDPTHYRIVLFDQRGSGRSLPEAEIQDNTTAHLIADIEALRERLNIARWVVFGGSWGSTLAIAYGQAHAARCIGFILRGIFLFGDDEVDWFVHGMARVFPEAQRAYSHFIPLAERGDLLAAYYRRLTDPDPAVHRPAAAAWCAYENACSRLIPAGASGKEPSPRRRAGQAETAQTNASAGSLAMARIECHYMINHGFLTPGQLLAGLEPLLKHPAIIVQGRYDMVCPIMTADRLAQAWPGALYRVVPDAGHSSMEPGIRAALVKAADEFKIYV
jgi:proline iminopeptidase